MQILLLTPAPPYPPQQGGALRNDGILRGLRSAGHEVDVLTFSADSLHPELARLCRRIVSAPPPLRRKADRLRDALLTDQPDIARRLWSDTFRDQLRVWLQDSAYDVIQFEGLEMAAYLPECRAHQPKARLVYDAHNAEAALQAAIARVEGLTWRRLPAAWYSRLQARRISRFERMVCQTADSVIAVSSDDAALLRAWRADGRIGVVENGIFTASYSSEALPLGDHALVFTGKMDYRPNVDGAVWFAERVFPLICAEIQGVTWHIVGQKPTARVQALAALSGVTVTGFVDDVKPYLRGAAVYVAPLRMGSGTRLKLLEALAAGCAVVATPMAAAGLNDRTKAAIITADDERSFAQAVIGLLNDPARRVAMARAGRAAVQASYDWSVLIPKLLRVYAGEMPHDG